MFQGHAVDRTGADAGLLEDRGRAFVGGSDDVGRGTIGDDVDRLAGLGDGHLGAGVGAVGGHRRGGGRQGREHAVDGRGGGPCGGLVAVDGHVVFGGGTHDDGIAVRNALIGGGGDEVMGTDGDTGCVQGVACGREEAGHVVGDAVNFDGHVTIGGADGGSSGAGHQEGRRGGDGNNGCAGGLNAHVSPDVEGSASRVTSPRLPRAAACAGESLELD